MIVEKYVQKQLQEVPEAIKGTIKDVTALKKLAELEQLICTSTSVFLDGDPVMTQYFAVQDQTLATKQEALQVAGSLAKNSRLPMFQAIFKTAQESSLPLREIDIDSQDEGVTGTLDRTLYVLGTTRTMKEEGIELGVTSQTLAQQLEIEGKQTVFLAQKQPKRLLAIFALIIPLDPSAAESIQALHELGVELVLLTEKMTRVVKGIAQPLGIQLIHSELAATEKQQIMQTFVERDPKVGFWVDSRTISLAPENGFVLLRSKRLSNSASILVRRLEDLPQQIAQSRAILKRAHKRFFWCKI